MSEWKDVPLVSVCDFHIGGTPSRETPAFWSDSTAGLPWLAISDLQTKYVGATSEYISNLGANSSNVKLIPEGSTVMSFKLSIGRTAITTKPMYCNEAIAFFEPKAGAVDTAWLYHALPSATGRVVTDIAVKGATLNKKKIAEIPLRLPPRPEQSAIARILDTLDTQIEKTQALIAKLEQVKQGLLHDLLTRGVDENGELRPSAEEAPELFKESALGLIPKGWRVARLDELATRITDGTHQAVKTVPQGADAIPFLFVSCVRHGTIRWDGASAISRKDYELISRGRETHAGMVLYTAVGSYGHAAVVDADVDFAFQRHIACISPREDLLLPAFLGYLLNADSLRRHADQVALGNAQKTVTLGELSRFPITLPSVKEQAAICSRARQLDLDLTALRRSETKLQTQKSGLMDDLLTGRVRVTPLLYREPAEAT